MSEATEKPQAPPAAPKKAPKAAEPKDTIWSRRDFFSLAGWAGFMATLGLSSLYFLRLLFPRVLFEPSPKFKAGKVEDYTIGDVSSKWVLEYRVWVVKEKKEYYAIFARCNHLGCTPLWLKT